MNLSEDELDRIAWTMLGEAHPTDVTAMTAVANVIANRASAGGYGKGIFQITRPSQFSAWQPKSIGGNDPQGRFAKTDPLFVRARTLAEQVMNGEIPDNTQGAVNYYAPAGMKDGKPPAWAKGKATVDIGGNLFLVGGTDGTGRSTSGVGTSRTRDTQRALEAAGFSPGAIDGVSGPRTKEAIRAFQQAKGLTPDGIVGPQTRAALARTSTTAPQSGVDRATAVSPGRGGMAPASAPAGQGSSFVRLASGKTIAPGTYPDSDGKHQLSITDDGHGNAVITKIRNPGEIPGIIDPLHEPKGTIAGSIVQNTIRDTIARQAPGLIDRAKPAVQSTASNFASNVGTQAQGLWNALGGLFGGAKAPASAPAGMGSFAKYATPVPRTLPAPAPLTPPTNVMAPASAPAGMGSFAKYVMPHPVNVMAPASATAYAPSSAPAGFGSDAAIRAFQASHGLVVDGIVGPKTLAAMNGTAPAAAPAASPAGYVAPQASSHVGITPTNALAPAAAPVAKAPVVHPGESRDIFGNDNAFNPPAIRDSKRWQTGY